MKKKYKHLQERGNHNLLTISVKESTADLVDRALEYLCSKLDVSRSEVVRKAIVDLAVENGLETDESLA